MTPEAYLKQQLETDAAELLARHEEEELARYRAIQNDIKAIKEQLDVLLKLFEQGKGALLVIKWLGLGVASLWAVALWARDHIHF